MGTQIHASDELPPGGGTRPKRRNRSGDVKRMSGWGARGACRARKLRRRNKDIVYVTERPTEASPIPQGLHWDLWLGPAPERPFNEVYFPGPKWYRWWDFGGGTMSDLGSHWNDLPFWALKLRHPLTIRGERSAAASGNRSRLDDRDV